MNEREILKHGQAKIQFFACREKVIELQEAGYSVRAIYNQLFGDGEITMSYNAFHGNLDKFGTHVKRSRKSRPVDAIGSNTNAISSPKPNLGKSPSTVSPAIREAQKKLAEANDKASGKSTQTTVGLGITPADEKNKNYDLSDLA